MYYNALISIAHWMFKARDLEFQNSSEYPTIFYERKLFKNIVRKHLFFEAVTYFANWFTSQFT
jgi:hypothetical protein